MGLRGDGTLVRVSWDHWARAERAEIDAADQWRTIRELDSGAALARLDGCEVVSFASNDYFGLSQHPAVRAAAHEAIERWGTGAGSARLIAGSRPVHSDLDRELADGKGAERALLFPTGFAANLGILSVVGGPDVTIISDQLNHASIIDGCRLARGEVRIYRHGDTGQVAQLLRDADRAVVVTDSVFSMDGDLAPLAELARLCAARDALLVIDEAHPALGPAPGAGHGRGARRPRPRAATDGRAGSPRRHAVEDARFGGRLCRGSWPAGGPDHQPGPVVHLHDRPGARGGRRGPGPAPGAEVRGRGHAPGEARP